MEKLGPRHPDVATSLGNIGNALNSKGEHDKAVEYLTRALDIRFETLGVHPNTALGLMNLSSSLSRSRQPQAAADCALLALHMLVSSPDFHHSLKEHMKSCGCHVDLLVQQERWRDVLPFLPLLDRAAAEVEGTSFAKGGGYVCLYLCAAAKVYRQCDMPSVAAAAVRRASAAIRQLGVPLQTTSLAPFFRNAGVSMDADELAASANMLDKLSRSRRAPEPQVPDVAAQAPAALRLRLPVRARAAAAALRASRGCDGVAFAVGRGRPAAHNVCHAARAEGTAAAACCRLQAVAAASAGRPGDQRLLRHYGQHAAAAAVPAGVAARAAAAAGTAARAAAVVGREAAEAGQTGRVQAGGCRGCGGSGSSALNEWRATNASRRCWRRWILFLFDDTRGSHMNLIRAQ